MHISESWTHLFRQVRSDELGVERTFVRYASASDSRETAYRLAIDSMYNVRNSRGLQVSSQLIARDDNPTGEMT